MLRRYHSLPDIRGGAPINDFVGVIIPEATTNLVTNPSLETGTTGWTAANGASIAQSAVEQYHGTYSLAVTPATTTFGGAFFGTVSLTSGTTYTASCKIKGIAGVPYRISIATTGAVSLAEKQVIGTGRWQWIWVTYTETSSASRRLYITKGNSTSVGVLYIDGVQVEAKAYVTTYCDGDQPGLLVGQQPVPYVWNGTPHASTSTRSALTRAGGRVIDIRTAYGFLLTAITGLGLAMPNNVSIPYTVLDGARYQRTTKPPRTFSLVGRFQGTTPAQLHRLRSDMRQAVDRDLVPIQQPLVLMVEPRDDCNAPTGDFAMIPCIYAGGLEGNDTSALAEDVAPTFTTYIPYLIGGETGASLSVQTSVSNANAIVQRGASGVWGALSTGMSGGAADVYALARGLDGTLYAGGNFTDAGGSGADYIAKWNGSSWAVLGSATAINDSVNAIAVGPDGRIYVGGAFLNASGIAAADFIAVYNPATDTWAALGTGMVGGPVAALAFGPTGILYAGGSFTDAGGSGADNIAQWDGTNWTVPGSATALNGSALGLAFGNGLLYVGGGFTDAGGVTDADRIATWNPTTSAWGALSTGMNSTVNAVAVGLNGIVYAGGAFTAAGGISTSRIAQWNGSGWAPLGTGVNGTVEELRIALDGSLYAGGALTTANGVTLPDRYARWNGSTWMPGDIDLPGTATVYAFLFENDGRVTLGFDTAGTATAAAVTTVTNTTPGYVYPRIVIKGPSSGSSRIYQLVNYTTGFGIWLNLTLLAGETVTINTDPQALSFVSDFQGDITSKVLPGSQPALMYLAPGSNSISFFAASSTVTATLSWQKRYNGVADLVN